MGSSGSKTATCSEVDASRCSRCRNKSSQPSSPSCSCMGILRTHDHLHLLLGEEEEEEEEEGEEEKDSTTREGEDEEDKHDEQVLTKETDDNTTCSSSQQQQTSSSELHSISTPPPPPPPPRPRFSFIPSNFSFRLTRAASFGSSTRLPIHLSSPSPLPPHSSSSHQHHHTTLPAAGEPVRFSRTLSVGRLRDRVLLRRSHGPTPTPTTHPLPTTPTETRYHDLVDHTTDFLERRRRIRSQVRALQRLGSRFENLSGHERSCILAGHYRSGRCTCMTSNRTRNLDDDTSARVSISRIVMLAEALFEVLDEIHQQSVVLSSRSVVSSLGSIPAPREVVDLMPVKIYTKLQKHQSEDVSQCYICLLDYEEGDCMRILPCHHEFHQTCIDKWLKEIHRVCPLCRGDVCRSDSLTSDIA